MLPATTDKNVLRLHMALVPVVHQPDGLGQRHVRDLGDLARSPDYRLLGVISRFTEALPQRDSIAPAPVVRQNAIDEDRDLQRERHQWSPPGAATLARRGQAGRRLPAGAQSPKREIPGAPDPGSRLPRSLARPEELERRRHTSAWQGADGDSRGLPGDLDDTHSRYIEAAVDGVLIGCLYLPNGNPAPGPKFDYKLRWFERLARHARELLTAGMPVVLAGDFNVMPTDLDVYKPERWVDDALFRPEVREVFHRLLAQGWTDALRALHPGERIYTFWDYFRNAWARNAGLRIDHLLLGPIRSGASRRGGCRPGGARLGKGQRSRADLDRTGHPGGSTKPR